MPRKTRDFDAIVIGAGPAGETCAGLLATGGLKVVVVERERVGGECAFWGCVPTKVLSRSAEPSSAAKRVPGSRQALRRKPSFRAAARWRTDMVGAYDDGDHAQWLCENGIELIRGDARIAGPGEVEVDGTTVRARHIVVATGSRTAMPHIAGLEKARPWTNREATAAKAAPRRLVVLGGGAIGLELAHVFARYGSKVTVIEAADRLLPEEDEGLSQLVAASMRDDGVRIRCKTEVASVRRRDDVVALDCAGGDRVVADELLVASGRDGTTSGLGLERAGASVRNGAVAIDDRCRAADGIWAIGDVAGGRFTHVAKYHAHVAAANILGRSRTLDMRAVPRTLFTEPDAAAVGLTYDQARNRAIDVEVKRSDFDALTRSKTYYEDGTRGAVSLLVDRSRDILVGAWAFGPMAAEWIAVATVAIATRAPVAALREVLFAYPTFTEAFHNALAVE